MSTAQQAIMTEVAKEQQMWARVNNLISIFLRGKEQEGNKNLVYQIF